jgi:type I pantothenate kinase
VRPFEHRALDRTAGVGAGTTLLGMTPDAQLLGPYVELSRADWAELAEQAQTSLDAATLERVRGLGDPTDMLDVREVYLPLTRLLSQYFEHTSELHRSTNDFLQLDVGRTPFVIGIAGSVAVGKSTTARLLRELLAGWPEHPRVSLVTTDGFLLPNAELERRGLMQRKGFPESYDRRALLRFVMAVKSGAAEVAAPVYDHLGYDIVPGAEVTVQRPDILIVEGLNVLQPARVRSDSTTGLAVSDFFDFSVYVDADAEVVRDWYVDRFLRLRETAFRDPRSYFTRYAVLTPDEAVRQARHLWDTINGPNLVQNILPTRGRATAILRKAAHHRVQWVRIRKL